MDNMFHLIQSQADDISPLTGYELIESKVHEMALQAAAYGSSFNLYNHNTTFAQVVLDNWPTEVNITLIGSNIGGNTFFGSRLTTELDLSVDTVAYAFNKSVGYNTTHKTWDATAVYYAVRGLDDVYSYNFTHGEVRAEADADTYWNFNSSLTNQNAVVFAEGGIGNASFAARLEEILLWSPGEAAPNEVKSQTLCVSGSNSTTPNATRTGSLPSPTFYSFTGTGVKATGRWIVWGMGTVFPFLQYVM
jgi:hypothetical protein